MIRKIRSSLFAKVFILTMFFLLFASLLVFGILAWVMPRTYSRELNNELDIKVKSFVSELNRFSFKDSGKLFDRFIYTNDIFSVELYSDSGELLDIPTTRQESASENIEKADNTAPLLSSTYTFYFLGDTKKYSLVVYGEAAGIYQLEQSFIQIFPFAFLIIIMFSLFVSWIFSYITTYPILKICDISAKISAMQLDWELEKVRTDELGTLQKSLNDLTKKLQTALTDLQTANAKLEADIEHEKALEQAQLDFFSAVSHELKTPITIIKGQTEGMLLNIGNYSNRDKFLSRSLEIINTMENMVQEILTIANIKSSKMSSCKEIIDFSGMLSQEYRIFEDMIVNKDLNFIPHIALNLQITGDKRLIQKVINNLMSNAISYSPKGSRITLTAYKENEKVIFSIENAGVNIPENEFPKLFDAFYRVEHSRNRKTGGSGLGLYIVKIILDEHNALYGIKNTEKGVLFFISFNER